MPGHKEQQHSTAAPKPLGPMLRPFPGGLPSKSLLGTALEVEMGC